MADGNGSEASRRRPLMYTVVAMLVGFVFLLFACGLLAWSFLVEPVPRSMAIVAAVMGGVAATAILGGVVAYGFSRESKK